MSFVVSSIYGRGSSGFPKDTEISMCKLTGRTIIDGFPGKDLFMAVAIHPPGRRDGFFLSMGYGHTEDEALNELRVEVRKRSF